MMKTSKICACGAVILLWLMILAGCSKTEPQGGDAEEGGITLSLKTDHTQVSGKATTKADPTVTSSMFKVRVENTRGEVLRTWDSFLDVPSQIRMTPGSYKLAAWYGGDDLPAFESPYYYGESKIAVTAGKDTATTITARHAATRVFVNFKEGFDFSYAKYYVDLKTTGDSLRYTSTEKRGGYFMPGTLRMRFSLVKENGDSVNYVSPTTLKVAARESYTLNMDVNSSSGTASITIQTDGSTNDTTIVVELPDFVMPKAAPVVTASGFTLGETVSTTEGVSYQAAMAVKAAGGLKSLYIKNDSQYLLSQGMPAHIDIINATDEFKTLMKNLGLSWSEELDDPEVALATNGTVYVNFTDLIKNINNLSGTDETTTFEVVAEDKYQQTNSPAKLSVKVAPVVFSTVTPTEGNVFAKSAEMEMDYISEREAPVLQVKINGEWVTPTQNILSNENGHIVVRIDGLTPSTSYTFRTAIHDHVYSEEYTFTTEAAAQVPNSTMDQWSTTTRSYKGFLGVTYNVDQIWPYASGETDIWWATRNPASTSQETGATNIYCANNGTEPVDIDGNKAAQIMTTAWGGYNTSIINGGGTKKNITAGMLFIGTYAFTIDGDDYLTSETINLGHGFSSRPATFSFRYMYAPLNGESFRAYAVLEDRSSGTVKEIARAEITDGEAVSSMKQKNIPFVYNSANKYVKATHITIYFISSTASSPATTNSGTATLHYGSKLTVDDIVLGYDF